MAAGSTFSIGAAFRALLAAALLAFWSLPASAAEAPRQREWKAAWIAHPEAPPQGAGVYHFRKAIVLDARPERFVVRVSADNRYRLFVNGRAVLSGPARGDLMHWRYEAADLAPYLKRGRNIVAALVWNWGDQRPAAQISQRTAFLLGGEGAAAALDTGSAGWRVLWNRGYGFAPVGWPDNGGYYVAGPGETIDGGSWPWGWETGSAEGPGWTDAQAIVIRSDVPAGAVPRGSHMWGDGGEWQLVPRNIPAMEERPVRFAGVRRAEGVEVPARFASGRGAIVVAARSRASFLLDQGQLTMGYPVLVASGGDGARATLTYAEALYDSEGKKGHRDVIDGKTIRGVRDRILFEGGEQRRYQPLWLRAWRYVQVEVETAGAPLRIEDVHGIFTAYPFEQKAAFTSDQGWIEDVWEIDWRVFRLSAFETFWDTPYYEQLQYVGDTRIESLLSLYNAGDDRLMRNAIEQFDHSRMPEGLTASRYPSALPQYIPPFSLWWTAMVHDHWMHRGDEAFASRFLPGVRGVIAWYERHVGETGMLGPMPWWNFLDWAPAYERGVPPGAADGHSTPLTFQFAYALQRAAELEQALGQPAEAVRYRALADRLIAAARRDAWDAQRGLFADTPEKISFGQQANALAVLVGAVPEAEKRAVMERVLEDASLVQASFYFRFYVDEALREAGLADRYLERLEPWREMIRMGLTTTPETPEPTRSDSHAWSAHPNYHLLATLLGIRPAAPGFAQVRIAPALGDLRRAGGRVPHPAGTIAVELRRVGADGIAGEVTLPEGVGGSFEWRGRSAPLRPGKQKVKL